MNWKFSSAGSAFRRLAVFAIVTFASGFPSWAIAQTAPAAYGAAAIGNLNIRVVDLDLFDGVDASYRFLRNAGGATGYAFTNMEVTSFGQHTQFAPAPMEDGFLQFRPFEGTVSGPSGTSVHGSVTPVQGGVAVAASATTPDTSFLVSAGTQTLYYEYMAHSLWLAPHTALEISLNGGTFASVSGTCEFSGADCGYVTASTLLQGSTFASPDQPFASLSSTATYGGQQTAHSIGTMSISLSNFSAGAEHAYLFANATVQGVTPVPEPSTYALLLMGLAGLAYACKKRNGRPTALLSLSPG